MRTAQDLLAHLKTLGVELWRDGERIRYRAKSGFMTPSLVQELRGCQQELKELLSGTCEHTEERREPTLLDEPRRQPASSAQRRRWLLHALANRENYVMWRHYRLVGPLDGEILARSLSEIVRRHEVLRTALKEDQGELVQVVTPQRPVDLPIHDLSHLPRSEWEEGVRRIAQEARRQPFAIERGEVLRALLVKVAPEEHFFLLYVDHVAYDGWSSGLLMRELSSLYQAFALGQRSPLAALPAQYGDFAIWEQTFLHGPEIAESLAYWRERLSGLEPLDLPTDYPRPAISQPVGRGHFLTLNPHLVSQLHGLARDNRTTLYVVLLAAFQLLLHRYTGQRRIAVGTPVANRQRREFETLIGCFSNPVVMCCDMDGDPPFLELLARVRSQVLEAIQHASVPFDRVVEELRPTRDLSRNQLYQVIFSFEDKDAFAPSFELPGLTIGPVELVEFTVRMDMELVFWPDAGCLKGLLIYDTRLFAPATAARMMRHFAQLLESIARGSEQPVSALPILDEAERQAIIIDWNRTATDYPRHASIVELFMRQVERSPAALAVRYGERSLTYRELDEQSSQLAWWLRARGVGRETPVGLFLERSIEMIVGMLGILKAGGAYLPLDLDYPDERLALMAGDARVNLVLTEQRFASRARKIAPQHLLFDAERDSLAKESRTAPDFAASAEQLAYLIYTSGSTGRPKGIEVTQRGVVRLVVNTDYVTLGPEDRVAQASTATFDAATFEVWGALLHGAALVGIEKEVSLSPASFARALRERGITTLFLTTALFNRVVQDVPDAFATLSTVLFGGEAVDPRWPRLCLERGAPRRLLHVYGPTETTTFAAWHEVVSVPEGARTIPIGRPIANTTLHVLDVHRCPVPLGALGELYVGGDGVARGYLEGVELTAQKFLPDPFSSEPGARLYRTGDLVRRLADGAIEFVGRLDQQIKLRGFRIELGEIEAALTRHPAVNECTVIVHERPTDRQLVAFVVLRQVEASGAVVGRELCDALRSSLKLSLPAYMVPAHFEILDALPLTTSGKVDRAALQRYELSLLAPGNEAAPPRSATEDSLCTIWRQVLGRERVGIDDHFFDLGGHSLLLIQMRELLRKHLQVDVPMLDLFQHSTIRQLSRKIAALQGLEAAPEPSTRCGGAADRPGTAEDGHIAVIGMAGRFPAAPSIDALWGKLAAGAECITFFSAEEAIAAGADPALVADPRYVRAAGVLDGIEYFDAEFFGYSPREAETMDPQHRIFLECVHEALNHAGYAPRAYAGRIGVFAGSSPSTYLLHHIIHNRTLLQQQGEHVLLVRNSVDFLPTRASYKLDLSGPSISVQTACSTSLVAVHLACQSLRSGDCEIALAGGVTVSVPQHRGHLHQEGIPLCSDGHCRAFDASGDGIVTGSGAGVVVLKRLRAALADGDSIYAVIRGTAVNNDGADKAGYAAPSIAGQETVIRNALADAGISADSVSYVEAHGTGTPLGDPVEIAALTRAYRAHTERRQYCAIGSIKTNLGHLDAAAGVAGLIKVTQSLRHRVIPASLHFQTPNPKLAIETSPFFVNQALRPWEGGDGPRRAGVSSFGIGGTNAHVILEEAPPLPTTSGGQPYQLLVLSAKTRSALETMTANLAARLRAALDSGEPLPLADVAFTLQVGREPLDHRRAVVCRDLRDAMSALAPLDEGRVLTRLQEPCERRIVFMFPGHGAEHVHMARGLYEDEPTFRAELDRCAEILLRRRGLDIRAVLYPAGDPAAAALALEQATNAPPALFAIEYALAQLFMHWGIKPAAMLCHSVGEYVAACLAGVFKLEDVLDLVAARGELIQRLPIGAMLAVELAAEEAQDLIGSALSIAIIGTVSSCVVSGPVDEIGRLAQKLAARGIGHRLIHASRAGHSAMMDPILDEFEALVARMPLSPPMIPFTSSVSGTWIAADEATSPKYWARQMRRPVHFASSAARCLAHPGAVFLEVGPGRTLSSWVRKHAAKTARHIILSSLRHVEDQQSDSAFILRTLAQLWLCGVTPAWPRLHAGESRRRVALPAYPFERKRYWIDAAPAGASTGAAVTLIDMRAEESIIAALEQHLAKQLHAEPVPEGLDPAMNALVVSHALALLCSRGGLGPVRKPRSEIAARLGVLPRFDKLFAFTLRCLTDSGLARVDGDCIELTERATAVPPPTALAAALRLQLPKFAAVVDILERCMSSYADVLCGKVQNVAVMHSADGGSVSGQLEEPVERYWDIPRYQRLLREVMHRLLRAARGRPLRVLEIGGGFGRMTWDLVPYLAGMDVEYWFTDVSRSFVLDAEKRARAAGWDFMRFGILDVCAELSASGFSPESFDVILAFNVLHVAQNLSQTAELLEGLLVPGGVLLAIEVAQLKLWYLGLAALEEGFWRFEDSFRRFSPMLTHGEWEDFFRARNHHSVQVHPRAPERRASTDHGLIIVQKQGRSFVRRQASEAWPADDGKALHARPQLASAYAAPRNDLEQRLAELWQGTLGIEQIGIHDDFFTLGGDSLVAMRLLSRIRDALAIQLPGHMLLRASTIASLAAALAEVGVEADAPSRPAEGGSVPRRMLELLQAGSDGGVPLFLIPPSGGHLYCYRALMRAIGPAPRIYGFVIPGIDDGREPLSRVQELAAHCLGAMRAERPNGPYAIAGWSFGGVVAYEMAQQLAAHGERVALLGLIDAIVSGGSHWLQALDEVSLLASFAIDAGLLPRDSLREIRTLLSTAPPEERMQRVLERARQLGLMPQEITPDRLASLCQLFRGNLQALSEYVPDPYDRPVVLFRSTEKTNIPAAEALADSAGDRETLGWRRLCGDSLIVHETTGSHYTMMEPPGVEQIGGHLRRYLEQLSVTESPEPGPHLAVGTSTID